MTRKAGLAINRRIFVDSAFAGMSMLGLDARAEKPVTGATPMREFGKTGVKLTIVGQAGRVWPCCAPRRPRAPRCATPTILA